ncbi:DUF6624 domain-containing protein [Streptomyces iconiensis]|uniref:Uncharacterized protein n=1 Tax=Streptomyces iconiensis TaxID=1384038 RepID=A0ABT7A2E9_9ACTN|nr:DUF6624 domain-containing protein [Streptomyces iconiensis]MDJ1135518.1 hypothetical protein [Streptomyces iconiensis]
MRAEDEANAPRANSADLTDQLAWRRLTARHGDRLRALLEEHGGWPVPDEVGEEAATGAWLVAQHADRQLDVQRLAVRLLEQAVAEGTAGPEGRRRLAFLRDRLHVNAGLPQKYGTQIQGLTSDGAPIPWPIENPDMLDVHRARAGIPPFATYTAAHAPKEHHRS